MSDSETVKRQNQQGVSWTYTVLKRGLWLLRSLILNFTGRSVLGHGGFGHLWESLLEDPEAVTTNQELPREV